MGLIKKHNDILVKLFVAFYSGAIWFYIMIATILLSYAQDFIGYYGDIPLLESLCSFWERNPYIVSACMIYCNILNYIIQPLQSTKKKIIFLILNIPLFIHNLGITMFWWGLFFIR